MTGKEALKEYREIYVDKTFKGECCPTQDWYLKIIEEELQIANANLEVKQSFNDRQFELLMKFDNAIKKLKEWYLPCGVEFETEEYEEFDDDGELIKVIEYYMIDKNTDEIYELNGLEEFRFMKEVLGNGRRAIKNN